MIVRGFSVFLILLVALSVSAQNCDWANQSFRVGKKYFESQNYLLALTTVSPLIESKCSKDISDKSYLMSLRSAYELKDSHLLRTLLIEYNGAPLHRVFFLGEESSSLSKSDSEKIKIWNHRREKELFPKIIEESKSVNLDKSWATEYSNLNDKQKSMLLAGSMSALVPGLGHVYAGAYQSAAVSFALNLVLGIAVYELYDEGLDATATAAAFGLSITYVGNILSSVKAVKAYNNSLYYSIDEKFKKVILPEIFSF